LLERGGLDGYVSRVVTTADVRAYKPHPAPYRRALEVLRLPAGEVTLVAAHAWDAVGARAAGMQAVWVKRLERCWPLPVDAVPTAADLVVAAELVISVAAERGTPRATPATEARTRSA
jgi:2-haloacid dehalogenase